MGRFLVYSKDTDVKVLSVYWQSRLKLDEIVVRSGSVLLPSYFYPSKFLCYLKSVFDSSNEDMQRHAKSFLNTFILFGCDLCPGWVNMSHAVGLQTWENITKTLAKPVETQEEFIFLILKCYEKKNSGIKRWLNIDDLEIPLETRVRQARSIIKTFRGVESESVPLKSVIDLQIKRSLFITQFWIQKECFLDPNDFGWKQRDGNSFDIILQDEEDPLFSVPQSLLLGCACKKKCTNKCACIKDSNRYNKCSRITCKFCLCYKRVQDGANENLLASEEYQQYMDDLSSNSETDSGSESDKYNSSLYLDDSESDMD